MYLKRIVVAKKQPKKNGTK